MTTDVKSCRRDGDAGGFFTTGQGRILADFWLLARPESCWLILPARTGETIRTHLEKYKVASRVEVSLVGDRRLFELRGPRAGEAAAAGESGGRWIEGIFADSGSGIFFLLLKASEAEELLTAWMRAAHPLPLRRVSAAAAEIARIEDGELRFGVDFSGENFPQETGRENDVSYSKGCYLGQEVVARIHYRGGVQRLPRGLRFDAGEAPAAGAELLLDGRAVGKATSTTLSPHQGAIGLGLVHQRGASPGTRLEVAGGGSAEVVELPFAPSASAG